MNNSINRKLQIARQSDWRLINQEFKDNPECCFALGFEAGYRFAVAPRVEPPVMESGEEFESLPAKSKITPNAWRSRASLYEPESFDIVQPGIGALALVKNEQFALLIAAAPDLLEALQKMEFAFAPFAKDSTLANVIDLARAAIAKATGVAA